jgi:hypothetical protein
MKILFDNAASRATISSINELANYPASNLVSPFAEERWQEDFSEDPAAVITVTFDNPEDIDSLFFTYTNATGIYAVTNTGAIAHGYMHDVEATDDGEEIVTDDGYDIGIIEAIKLSDGIYWDSVQEDVTSVTIYVFGTENPLYLGEIGLGLSYSMPNPLANFGEGFEDNSIIASSQYGQVVQNYIDPLAVDSYNFVGVTRETLVDIKEKYKAVGVGGKVWVDLTSEKHEFKTPMYAVISAPFQSALMGNGKYSFTLSFTEAR